MKKESRQPSGTATWCRLFGRPPLGVAQGRVLEKREKWRSRLTTTDVKKPVPRSDASAS
jgi:hypothetical protein